jgi:2-(3-amino-3-carboxypropyl)histidine synthase
MKKANKPEVMFIEAIRTDIPKLNTKALAKLPKKIVLLYSIQYKPIAEQIKAHLKTMSYNIRGFKQVLGCTDFKTKDPILLVSGGRFHALNLALQNSVPIYIYNNQAIQKLSDPDIKKFKQKRKAALAKFLAADSVGILVSTKPGQNHMEKAQALKKKLESKGKKPYLFISNNINIAELENFSIQSWVNTACPGLAYDSSKIINLGDLSSIKY